MATNVAERDHRKWWSKQASDHRYSKSALKGVNERWLPARVKNLQKQTRVKKPRNFKPKRRSVPRAPYNDSSFLMRVRRTGGLAPPTPSLALPSPSFSNLDSVAYQDFLEYEDYGYGSMAGLIRLRLSDDDGDRSTVANNFDDVNMCVVDPVSPARNVEQRLDEGVSRFEMRSLPSGDAAATEDGRMKSLEEENVLLKDRLVLMQQEVDELRERLHGGQSGGVVQDDTQSCLGS